VGKTTFDLKAHVSHAVTTLPNGKSLKLVPGDTFATSDPEEERHMREWDAVKVAEKPAKDDK